MDINAKYITNIQSRSVRHFWIGVLARLRRHLIFRYSVFLARKKGATIGEYVSLPLSMARKANPNLIVGSHVSIQTDQIDLRAPVTIGSYVIIGSGVKIITCSHNIDSPDWEHKSYGISIEDYVWIATDALILPSCRAIKKGAVVAAGSVLPYNVNEMDIVSGNPATVLRKRKNVHSNLCVEGLLGNDLLTYLKVRNTKY